MTIHSGLRYSGGDTRREFYSAIPTITNFFSSGHPSSLKHLILDFDYTIYGTNFPLPSLVSNVICVPLVQLLSTISGAPSSSPSIRVDLLLNGNPLTRKSLGPSNFLLSALRGCGELMNLLEESQIRLPVINDPRVNNWQSS